MKTDTKNLLTTCLDEIEKCESRLLTWGVVDGAFSRDELLSIFESLLDKAYSNGLTDFITSDDIIDMLCQQGMVHKFNGRNGESFRSRMAETVRLMSRLRQLFPKHEGENGWQSAPNLVADFRFICRKRKYPKRDILSTDFLDEFNNGEYSSLVTQALSALINSRQKDFKLADFQLRATQRILEVQKKGNTTQGTIICAGTGCGKTLAFYLPALSHISSRIVEGSNNSFWVKALAIYPRNELLKDQFSEVYTEARRLDKFLEKQGKRKLRIGAYFGGTPHSADFLKESPGWKQDKDGFACQYLRCSSNNCNGKFVWKENDRLSNTERLQCNRCNRTIESDEIVLTRRRLSESPPDILFTTTEMLNQRLSDSWSRHLFGLGPKAIRAPEMVLLDEVHTYAGVHGAQVSFLLKRWQKLTRRSINFVGLSATLRNAENFFSKLTGLKEGQVKEVTPSAKEMETEGAEYLLALRGDPVSRTSLLSTTIQSAMLISRCLDFKDKPISDGVYGKKIFVFTDDIDVTNRLYFNILDAEGRDSFNNPDQVRHPNGGLAALRKSRLNFLRYEYGQDWLVCEQIGHNLANKMWIGRTSSQDAGVDTKASIIVATASLEVGFNDPDVGAIIQHKAPRDMAQFLQRKGRAGRLRTMRPWTLVVLSDYGRDRLAYQGYDLLFDPEIEPQTLPVKNRYIQRMQAVYTLIDYLGVRLQDLDSYGNVWRELSKPRENDQLDVRSRTLVKEMESLLQSDVSVSDFQAFLSQALNFVDTENQSVEALLWEYPRPIMTTVIPTTLRRLLTNWRKDGVTKADFFIDNSPLPEFAPANLFSDLNLPEVSLEVPPQYKNDKGLQTTMPVLQAMREFAPGRVSKRYGIIHKYVRHWLSPLPFSFEPEQQIDIEQLGEMMQIGNYAYVEDNLEKEISVYRPKKFQLTQPDNIINDSSNAQLRWSSQILAKAEGIKFNTTGQVSWDKIIKEISFHLHNHHSPVEVRRFAFGSTANILCRDGTRAKIDFNFSNKGQPVALGFNLLVDGVVFKVSVPEQLWADPESYSNPKWFSLRTSLFFSQAWQGRNFSSVSNPFAREWLAHIYISALSYQAIKTNSSLQEAAQALSEGRAQIKFKNVLETIFQSSAVEAKETVSDDKESSQDRLKQELIEYLANPQITKELEQLASCLWEPINEDWQPWLVECYKATLSAALVNAIQNLCSDLDTEGLIADILPQANDHNQEYNHIWITETTVGGTGLIEELITRFGEDPRRFISLVESALQASEFELIDDQLTRFLQLTVGKDISPNLEEKVSSFRFAESSKDLYKAFEELRSGLTAEGFILFHSFLASLNNRILRPGSSFESDKFILSAIEFWKDKEATLGIEIDPRIVAYILSDNSELDNLIEATNSINQLLDRKLWRFNAIYGLLWPKGSVIRQSRLAIYNPYYELPKTERLLVLDTIQQVHPKVYIETNGWQEACLEGLRCYGVITLVCENPSKQILKAVFNFLMTNPVEDDYLLVYPRLRAIRQTINTIEIDVEIVEALQ